MSAQRVIMCNTLCMSHVSVCLTVCLPDCSCLRCSSIHSVQVRALTLFSLSFLLVLPFSLCRTPTKHLSFVSWLFDVYIYLFIFFSKFFPQMQLQHVYRNQIKYSVSFSSTETNKTRRMRTKSTIKTTKHQRRQ